MKDSEDSSLTSVVTKVRDFEISGEEFVATPSNSQTQRRVTIEREVNFSLQELNITKIRTTTTEERNELKYDIPEYMEMVSSAQENILFSCSANDVWDSMRNCFNHLDIIITYDDMWSLEGFKSIDGEIQEVQACLMQYHNGMLIVCLNKMRGDIYKFLDIVDDIRRFCQNISINNSDEVYPLDKGEIYPGSMELSETDMFRLVNEMASDNLTKNMKYESAKELAVLMKCEKNAVVLAQQNELINLLLKVISNDCTDLQRFSLSILLEVMKKSDTYQRRKLQEKVERALKSNISSLHVATQVIIKDIFKL